MEIKELQNKYGFIIEKDYDDDSDNYIRYVIKNQDGTTLKYGVYAYRLEAEVKNLYDEKVNLIADTIKQGKQKAVLIPKFKVGDKIQYLKGCGTIMTIEKIENDEYIFANNMGHTTIESGNKWYLVEQKPVLSEEDEKIIRDIHCFLDYRTSCHLHDQETKERAKKIVSWLDELKNRVLPQSKQEWSEEDIEILESCISLMSYNDAAKEETDWLKSLKDRVQPKKE